MSAPLKIGVDIDGTVFPFTVAVNEALAERFDLDLPWDTPWNYPMDVNDTKNYPSQITPEQWEWVWTSEAAEPVFGRLDLIYGDAAEVLNVLAQEHHVHFVTHRNPYRLTEITGRWLKEHFRNYRGVHVIDNSVRKHTLADWDVFIEDRTKVIDELLFHAPNCLTMLACRPWNDAFRAPLFAPNFEAFRDWREAGGLIDDFAAVRATLEVSNAG